MGDGSGTKTGLVGEDAAGYAALHTCEEASDDASGYRLRVERALKDHGEHERDAACVEQYHAESKQDVEKRHERNQFLSHVSDTLNAAKKHKAYQKGKNDADHKADNRLCLVVDELVVL